ncbi:MAG: hypothetical protein GTN73_01455 [Candidatus Aminicenantes bacterium]|nr:hypothetical protein [Candidatus Aminicenantes bacterium]
MKNISILGLPLFFFLTFSLIPQVAAEEQSISEFISQIQESLDQKDIPAYLNRFSNEVREKERLIVNNRFNVLRLDSVTLFKPSKLTQTEGEAKIYLQALFQNSYSAAIETWHLSLIKVNDQWLIEQKRVLGRVNIMYKIKIPSERAERVKSIEVEHADIKLSFKDAIIFYDNIPGLETGLLILGKGHLHFYPSDPGEKHQLDLIYKKSFLEDDLTCAYLRFSDYFFRKNIRIVKDPDEEGFQASILERNKAYSLFSKYYSRSFTIENSLNKELLTALPQGNEVVFNFEGKKLGDLAYIYSPFTPEEINLYRWKDEKIINLYSPYKEGRKKRIFISFVEMFEVKSYKIEIDFKPQQFYISGKAKVEVESKVDSLERIMLKLNPELDILRIYDEDKRALIYSQDKLRGSLYVYFIHPPPENKPYSIEIYYRGKLVPPKQVTDVIAGLQFDKNLSYVTPKSETYLFSRSAFWYPSPPGDDYFKARLRIIVPPEYQCISNGELIEKSRLNDVERVEEIEKTGSSVYIFETKYPIKYLSFLVGKFIKVEEDLKSLPLKHFYASGISFQKKGLLEEAKNIIQFYENKFGPYPYEKLTIVRRIWSASGGHSPASFIVINELPPTQNGGLYASTRSPVDLSRWKEYFIAHEIAHQWWGQAVTWKTYHDQWLSEGLAQFSATLYLIEKRGEGVFPSILKKFSQWTGKKSIWGAITLGSRLNYHNPEAYQAIIYNKASLVLNMLRDLLGEEAFFKGLQEFFRRHKYGAASTKDFIKTIRAVSGKDLAVFFRNWFDSYVLPEVNVSHSVLKEEGGYILKLRINQQKEPFVFPLWVEWIENGNRVEKRLIIDERKEEFDFELESKPRKIKINPNRAVPGRFN